MNQPKTPSNSMRSIKLQLLEMNLTNLFREVKTTAFKLDALKASYQKQKFQFEALQRREFEATLRTLDKQEKQTKAKTDAADLRELKKILGTNERVQIFLTNLGVEAL